jgi:hypothetical protein
LEDGVIDPLRMFGALAEMYFATLLAPFAAGPLSVIPATGAASLIAGVVLAVVKRETGPIWAVLGAFLSHGLVASAGLLGNNSLVFVPFLALQLLISIGVILTSHRSVAAGALVAWFNITYALAAAFIAALSISGGI